MMRIPIPNVLSLFQEGDGSLLLPIRTNFSRPGVGLRRGAEPGLINKYIIVASEEVSAHIISGQIRETLCCGADQRLPPRVPGHGLTEIAVVLLH